MDTDRLVGYLRKRVYELYARRIDVTVDTTIDELGLDSLDMIELMMELEERYKVDILDSDFRKAKTVQDIVNLIEAYSKGI